MGDWRRRPAIYRCDEAVATLRHRLDEDRPLRVVAKRLPDLADRGVHALLEIDEGVGSPEKVANLIRGHEIPGPAQKQLKEPQRLRLQTNDPAALEEFPSLGVQLKGSKSDYRPHAGPHPELPPAH